MKLLFGRKTLTNLDSILKKQRLHFADKNPDNQSYDFSGSHVQMWELGHKEGWVHAKELMLSNCVAGEDSWEFLQQQRVKSVHPKGNQPRISLGRTDAEAEAPILWSPDVKSQLVGKDPDAGKDWGQEDRGQQRMRWLYTTTDSMDMNLSKLQEIVEDRGAWHAAVHEVTKSCIRLSNWRITTLYIYLYAFPDSFPL